VAEPPTSNPTAHAPKPQLMLKQLKVNVNLTNPGLMMFDITLQGRTYHALIDSGANGLFMGRKVVDELKLKTVVKSEADQVKLADGSYLDSDSVLRTTFSLGKYKDVDTFHVLDLLDLQAFDIILGMPWLRRLNPRIDWKKRTMTVKQNGAYHRLHAAISAEDAHLANLLLSALEFKQALKKKRNQVYLVTLNHLENPDGSPIKATSDLIGKPLSAEWQARLKDIVDRYQDVINPDPNWKPDFPPERTVDHIIEKIPGVEIKQRPLGRMGQDELIELRKQLADFLDRRYITPSTSAYASPVLMVKRPGVDKLRFCIDYRALNSATVKNAYPLPPVQDILDRLNGATVFSKMDLAQAYYQVRVAPESQHLTAFRCRYGLFEWKVMPLGLCNAPATFQRLIMDVLRPYLDDFVMPYLDDLLIFSKNDEEHLEHLEKVLIKLREHKLYARPKKCEFGKRRMKFLGHYVQCVHGKTTQICVDPEKIKAVQDWPRPTTQKEVLQFKGLAEFL
ncbi:hypothetical protein CEUSTIGMA_g14024.t1, partial [Chlamydomonas eustigma]